MFDNAIQSLINGDLFLAIFQVIMGVILAIANIILLPFSMLISEFLPELDGALSNIASYFDLATTYLSWLLYQLAIPEFVVQLIATYYLFVFSVTIGSWSVKLLLHWKKALWG